MTAAPGPSAPLVVLVVCRANVCRSPLSEALLRHELTPLVADLVLSSAGTRTQGGEPCCALGAKALTRAGLPDAVRSHRSRPLDPDDITGADLVIGSDRGVCTEIIAALPAARPRVFTMREIPVLAERVVADDRSSLECDGPEAVRALVAMMSGERRRAWRSAPSTDPVRRRLLPTRTDRSAVDARWDVADGHGGVRESAHRGTVRQTLAASAQIASVLSRTYARASVT